MHKEDITGPRSTYVMDDNDAKAVSSIDHEDETTQNSFHLAKLSTSNKSPNTITADLSPHFPGFQ